MLKYFLSTLFSVILVAPVQGYDKTMSKKWNQLYTLIQREKNVILGRKRLGPRLRRRIVELRTEKLKLIKEKENKIFLESSFELRAKRSKSWFFQKSDSLYREIRNYGLLTIKKYPRFRYKADIFFTLALNSRDYGGDKETENFLIHALKNAKKNSPIVHNAKTSLAEYYYNQKKYRKAVVYYRDVLKNQNDEWYTKHLLNYSWCLIKTQKYHLAIEASKEAYLKGSRDNYIDVSEQVLDSIGLFYILGEKVREGALFYTQHVEKPGRYMIKMAKKTADNGHYKDASHVFNLALKNSIDKKQHDEEVSIRLALLEFYRNFHKEELFFKNAQALNKLNTIKVFKTEQQSEAVEKILSYVGHKQTIFTRNKKINLESHDEYLRERILAYFDILRSIDPIKADYYSYHQGETLYSVGLWKRSFSFYKKSLEINIELVKKKPVKELKKSRMDQRTKLFDSLFTVLERASFSKDQKYQNTVYTYKRHLELYPVHKRSQKIYPKLFNLFHQKRNIQAGLNILYRYKKNYPTDLKIQKGMFTKIMDHFIKTKNADRIAHWIKKLEKGFLSFDTSYIEKAVVILGNILFERYDKLDGEGKQNQAIAGISALYQNKKYPQSIKAKAAFKVAQLNLKLSKLKEATSWSMKSMGLFIKKERAKRKKKFSAITYQLANLQSFDQSIIHARHQLIIYCYDRDTENEKMIKKTYYHLLLQRKFKQLDPFIKKFKKCGLGKDGELTLIRETFKFYYKHRMVKSFLKYRKKYGQRVEIKDELHQHLLGIYDFYRFKEGRKNQKFIFDILKEESKGLSKTKSMKIIRQIISFQTLVQENKKRFLPRLYRDGKSFNEVKFNKSLEQAFSFIKKQVALWTPYIKKGRSEMILVSSKILSDHYLMLATDLKNYRPNDVPKEFIKSFKQAMAEVVSNLEKEGQQFYSNAKQIIEGNDLFELETRKIITHDRLIEDINYRHLATRYALPMNKGGRR
jgi:hypothetical protein